jgi:magnesium chelatase accessory protein
MAVERSGPLVWDRDGRDWPGREGSRFIRAGGIDWHVQQSGRGPVALLLHGTGASTHSWAWIAPYLASRYTLIAPDLPGHAFTGSPPKRQITLSGMAEGVAALLAEMRLRPDIAIGHSAGAAVLVRMALSGTIAPSAIVSLNGALTPFRGTASRLFPAAAKLLFTHPLTTHVFAWRAGRPGVVAKLIEGTGSHIPPQSLAIYERLFRSPAHVGGALAMMANWDLEALDASLPQLKPRLVQIVGSNDIAVPPDLAFQIAERVPGATVDVVRGPGHLAHEEEPRAVAEAVFRAVDALSGAASVA